VAFFFYVADVLEEEDISMLTLSEFSEENDHVFAGPDGHHHQRPAAIKRQGLQGKRMPALSDSSNSLIKTNKTFGGGPLKDQTSKAKTTFGGGSGCAYLLKTKKRSNSVPTPTGGIEDKAEDKKKSLLNVNNSFFCNFNFEPFVLGQEDEGYPEPEFMRDQPNVPCETDIEEIERALMEDGMMNTSHLFGLDDEEEDVIEDNDENYEPVEKLPPGCTTASDPGNDFPEVYWDVEGLKFERDDPTTSDPPCMKAGDHEHTLTLAFLDEYFSAVLPSALTDSSAAAE